MKLGQAECRSLPQYAPPRCEMRLFSDGKRKAAKGRFPLQASFPQNIPDLSQAEGRTHFGLDLAGHFTPRRVAR